MRITENRMVQLASASLSAQRERVARSGEQLSSGERVSRPSQDPAAWSAARRAEASKTINDGRGQALARSQERLALVDGALAQMGSVMSRARELAVSAASDTIDPESLEVILVEVRGLRQSALAAANTRGSEGEYVLAGSESDQAPFDPDGVYQGDDVVRFIETQNGLEQSASVTGAVLTSAAGVDIFAQLAAFETALQTRDRAGISAAIGAMTTGNQQISAARADGGSKSAALLAAEDAQRQLDGALVELHSRLVGSDPIAAASELARHSSSLEAAQVVAQRIIDLTRP
jgi:flagellar hook-associated protein 3 FlgL